MKLLMVVGAFFVGNNALLGMGSNKGAVNQSKTFWNKFSGRKASSVQKGVDQKTFDASSASNVPVAPLQKSISTQLPADQVVGAFRNAGVSDRAVQSSSQPGGGEQKGAAPINRGPEGQGFQDVPVRDIQQLEAEKARLQKEVTSWKFDDPEKYIDALERQQKKIDEIDQQIAAEKQKVVDVQSTPADDQKPIQEDVTREPFREDIPGIEKIGKIDPDALKNDIQRTIKDFEEERTRLMLQDALKVDTERINNIDREVESLKQNMADVESKIKQGSTLSEYKSAALALKKSQNEYKKTYDSDPDHMKIKQYERQDPWRFKAIQSFDRIIEHESNPAIKDFLSGQRDLLVREPESSKYLVEQVQRDELSQRVIQNNLGEKYANEYKQLLGQSFAYRIYTTQDNVLFRNEISRDSSFLSRALGAESRRRMIENVSCEYSVRNLSSDDQKKFKESHEKIKTLNNEEESLLRVFNQKVYEDLDVNNFADRLRTIDTQRKGLLADRQALVDKASSGKLFDKNIFQIVRTSKYVQDKANEVRNVINSLPREDRSNHAIRLAEIENDSKMKFSDKIVELGALQKDAEDFNRPSKIFKTQ